MRGISFLENYKNNVNKYDNFRGFKKIEQNATSKRNIRDYPKIHEPIKALA